MYHTNYVEIIHYNVAVVLFKLIAAMTFYRLEQHDCLLRFRSRSHPSFPFVDSASAVTAPGSLPTF